MQSRFSLRRLESALQDAQGVKKHVDQAVTTCMTGSVRRMLVHTILKQLPEDLGPDLAGGLKLLLTGSDALRLIAVQFTTAMEALSVDESAYFEKKDGARKAAAAMQEQLVEFEASLASLGSDLKFTALLEAAQPAQVRRLTEKLGATMMRLKTQIDDVGGNPAWLHLRTCLHGRDPALRAPRRPDEGDANKVVNMPRGGVTDIHISMHETRSAPAAAVAQHVQVFRMRMGYLRQMDEVAASDMVTITVPFPGDATYEALARDFADNMQRVTVQSSGLRLYTYNIRAAARYVASLIEARASGESHPGSAAAAVANYVRVACLLQTIRAVCDAVRGEPATVDSAASSRLSIFGSPSPSTSNASGKPQSQGQAQARAQVKVQAPTPTQAQAPTPTQAQVQPEARAKAQAQAQAQTQPEARANTKAKANAQTRAQAADAVDAIVEKRFAPLLDIAPGNLHALVNKARRSAAQWIRVVLDVCDQSAAAKARMQSMAAAYDRSSSEVFDLAGGGRRSRGNNNNRGSGNRRSRGNKGRRGDGSSGDYDRGKGKGKGKGDDKEDREMWSGLSPECDRRAKDPVEKMDAIKTLLEWYNELQRTVHEPVKKLVDKANSQQVKRAMDCMPMSVKDRVEGFQKFLENVNTYYMARLVMLYQDQYQKQFIDKTLPSKFVFSTPSGELLNNPTDPVQREVITRLFETRNLIYKSAPLWDMIIDPNFAEMFQAARRGMNSEPSPAFREAVYDIVGEEFFFMWEARDYPNVYTVVSMKVDVDDASGAIKRVQINPRTVKQVMPLITPARVVMLTSAGSDAVQRMRTY